MIIRNHIAWRFLGVSVMLPGAVSCFGEPAYYFSDAEAAPKLEAVSTSDSTAGDVARENGLQGGALVILAGTNLYAEQLSVRFGDHAATVLTEDIDPSGKELKVLSPPSSVSGGRVDVSVSHASGVTTLSQAYEYVLPDQEVFAREAASLEVIGFTPDRYLAAAAFWPDFRPRQVGSLLEPGALYYLPVELELVHEWPSPLKLPSWYPEESTPAADQLTLEAVGYPDVAPIIVARDPHTGRFEACPPADGATAEWIAGNEYQLTLSGGALLEPVVATVFSPPAVVGAGGAAPDGLHLDDLGIAQVDMGGGLFLGFLPGAPEGEAEAAYLLIELVVTAPEKSLPDSPYEVARLVLQASDELGHAAFSSNDLMALPEVDTTCAVLGRQLEAANLAGDTSTSRELETTYPDTGCLDIENPLQAYPYLGNLRISRHYVHRVSLPPSVSGCPEPGNCSEDAELLVDLVSAYEVRASFMLMAACQDWADNDGDGLIDLDDPGCAAATDDSELDETGLYPCDDAKDNDGDGLVDFAPLMGDPGCNDRFDPSELGTLSCDDGLDNDGDGLTDFRLDAENSDPGCTSASDDDENGTSVCDDGIDNDRDGTIDYRPNGSNGDPGCESVTDESENGAAVCDDGIDNDEDGYADYQVLAGTGDPGCSTLEDPDEIDQTGKYPCDDGIDNDRDGDTDGDDGGCRDTPLNPDTYDPYDIDELNPKAECDDGVDNDLDGYIDYRPDGSGDPECLSAIDISERN